MNINKTHSFTSSIGALGRVLLVSLVSVTCFIGLVSPSLAQNTAEEGDSCNRPDFDRTQDTGIFVWQLCTSGQWFLRVSAGGLPANSELRVIGNIRLSKPIQSVEPFSLFLLEDGGNDDLNTDDPQNITFNLRVFKAAQDGIDFKLEEGTVACLNLKTSIEAPITIGGDNIVVKSPVNIVSVDKEFCVGALIVPPTSILLFDDL